MCAGKLSPAKPHLTNCGEMRRGEKEVRKAGARSRASGVPRKGWEPRRTSRRRCGLSEAPYGLLVPSGVAWGSRVHGDRVWVCTRRRACGTLGAWMWAVGAHPSAVVADDRRLRHLDYEQVARDASALTRSRGQLSHTRLPSQRRAKPLKSRHTARTHTPHARMDQQSSTSTTTHSMLSVRVRSAPFSRDCRDWECAGSCPVAPAT